jgi:hypothetical protein
MTSGSCSGGAEALAASRRGAARAVVIRSRLGGRAMARRIDRLGMCVGLVLLGCGGGGREGDEAGQTGGLTGSTGAAPTTTAPTTTMQGGTESESASEGSISAGGTTTSTSTSTTTVGETSGTTQPDDTGPATGTTTGDTTTGDPCGGRGNGVFDFSYLWVANTSQGSISKVNTKTMTEEGRYYVDPNPGGASSSRTSVNIDGHFVVVSNRASGTVTKVAASAEDCVDNNGNGMIETSQNKDDLLAWGADECVIWNTPVNPPIFGYQGGPRGTAWAPGEFNEATCKYENQKVWVGWLDTPAHATIGRFDGITGVQDAAVGIDNWTQEVLVAPYGGAVDGAGNVWFIAAYREVFRINTETLELKRWPSPGISMYGMTVDSQGDVWFGTYNNEPLARFNHVTETFEKVNGPGQNHRGLAIDADGIAWAASNAGGTNGCGLDQVDTKTMTVVQFHTFEQCGTPVGVSIDVDGFVWMVDYNGWAYRIDPNTYEKVLVPIAGDHYTYSDMTGGGLVNAVMPG